jgi:hypothetical protein
MLVVPFLVAALVSLAFDHPALAVAFVFVAGCDWLGVLHARKSR